MKKLLTIILFSTIVTTNAFATQYSADVIAPGTMLAGGFVTFSWSKESIDNLQDSEVTEQVLGFSPMVGYFIYPNLALMASLNYTKESVDTQLQTGTTISEKDLTGAMGGLRYYIPTGKIYLYAGFMGGMYQEESTTESEETGITLSSLKTKGYQFNIHGGLLYMVSKNIGLELGVQFIYTKGEVDDESIGTENQDLTDYSFALGYFGIQALF